MHLASQFLVFIFGGLSLGWLAVERLDWSPLMVPLGAVAGLALGLLSVYKQTVLLPQLKAQQALEQTPPQAEEQKPTPPTTSPTAPEAQ